MSLLNKIEELLEENEQLRNELRKKDNSDNNERYFESKTLVTSLIPTYQITKRHRNIVKTVRAFLFLESNISQNNSRDLSELSKELIKTPNSEETKS